MPSSSTPRTSCRTSSAAAGCAPLLRAGKGGVATEWGLRSTSRHAEPQWLHAPHDLLHQLVVHQLLDGDRDVSSPLNLDHAGSGGGRSSRTLPLARPCSPSPPHRYVNNNTEIADHTMTHADTPNASEINGNLRALNAFAGIPMSDIIGFRAPLLSWNGSTLEYLHNASFTVRLASRLGTLRAGRRRADNAFAPTSPLVTPPIAPAPRPCTVDAPPPTPAPAHSTTRR